MPTALFHFATVTVSFQSQYEQRIKQRIGRTTKTFESYRTNTIGFELQMNKVFNERLFVVYGFEYYGDDVQTAAIEENLASGAISISLPFIRMAQHIRVLARFAGRAGADQPVGDRWRAAL